MLKLIALSVSFFNNPILPKFGVPTKVALLLSISLYDVVPSVSLKRKYAIGLYEFTTLRYDSVS